MRRWPRRDPRHARPSRTGPSSSGERSMPCSPGASRTPRSWPSGAPRRRARRLSGLHRRVLVDRAAVVPPCGPGADRGVESLVRRCGRCPTGRHGRSSARRSAAELGEPDAAAPRWRAPSTRVCCRRPAASPGGRPRSGPPTSAPRSRTDARGAAVRAPGAVRGRHDRPGRARRSGGGLLARTLGRRAEAEERLRAAVALCERMDARAYLAIARYDLGRLLLPTRRGSGFSGRRRPPRRSSPCRDGCGGRRRRWRTHATRSEPPENAKSPAERGFSECAEEDSNLHPVIPDQALKTVGT